MIRNALRHSSRAVGAVATTSKATVVSRSFLIEYALVVDGSVTENSRASFALFLSSIALLAIALNDIE